MEINLNLSIIVVISLLAATAGIPPQKESHTEMTIGLEGTQGSLTITVTTEILYPEDKFFLLKKEGSGVEDIEAKAGQEGKSSSSLKVTEPEFQLTVTLELDGEILRKKSIVGNNSIVVEEELLGNLAVPRETETRVFPLGFTIFNTSRKTMEYRVTAFGDKFHMTEHDPILLNPGSKEQVNLSISPVTEGNGNLFVNFLAGEEIILSKYYAVTIIASGDSKLQSSGSSSTLHSFRWAYVLVFLPVFLLVSAILLAFYGRKDGGGLKW
jgi:hypothetical protein